ncbi:MAG: HAD family hydrolase [Acetobacteraceae bacterium]|nr:HAD family hydrolase [Acetobacteraceae bacterium]
MARTLLLDLDGTLVDTVPDLATALNRLMRSRGLAPFGHAETAAMVGDGVAVLVGRAFAARGLTPDERAVADFAGDYGRHAADESRPYPGVPELLRELAAEGWRLAVCTNKPEAAARALLEALDLMKLLRAVGGGDSFPVRKPDPAHLLATLAAAGGTPDRTVMIGDHANDVVAARGAGVKSVFVTWGYGPMAMAEGADAVAATLPEMAEAARRLVPFDP